jgi:hypothetical protein
MTFQIRRGTNAERQTIVFAEGELVYTTDTKDLYVGDGTTLGGVPADIIDGSDYRINIVGNDSSTIIDSNTNNINGNLLRVTDKIQVEGRVELGVKASNNDTFVPGIINDVILSSVVTQDPVENGNYVKTVYSHRLGRYSSGGELLLTFADVLSEDPPNRFLVSKFLFHNSGTDTWVVTPIGDSGNQALLSSVSINRVEQGIDTFLTVTVRIPTNSITSATMNVTGQISFTSNPLILTVSGF